MAMRFRRWLGRQPWASRAVGTGLGLWIRLCHATTRWEFRGDGDLAEALKEGPVLIILWHERIAMAGIHWRAAWGPMLAVHSDRFAGRVAGAAQAHVGLRPVVMASRQANRTACREVMRLMHEGCSLGLTGDGPSGPVRIVKDAPLDWASTTGRPVFAYAFATRRHWRVPSWDRLVWPQPFTRGAVVWQRWDAAPPRRMDAATREALRRDLAAALTAAAEDAEALARGHQAPAP
ncbi:lysophospholipid acyltransferase family protein [Rubellimicrobium roseum]|uniref:DUF374 domain-containing protein n=1 Tax=Rubellimicrobium roseum TaxID=687525 RepID=A0A5C4N8Z1_9RHOB|nr:DUF374 domain-containing protein [Rubellimicrobium roseum]TNC62278.1 DUF374 domain-containing protein [Rubellimicrobium roseum]